MSVFSATTSIYNEVIHNNYNKLLSFSRGDDDNVHASYIKVQKRITEKGFTGNTQTELATKLVAYTKTVIFNNWKTEITGKKKKLEINYEAENKLQFDNTVEETEKEIENQTQFVTLKLFEYLKKNYNEADNYVFRVYYLYDETGKKITYHKLSKITGYSVSKCCGIIQKIKSDLKLNLTSYINGTN